MLGRVWNFKQNGQGDVIEKLTFEQRFEGDAKRRHKITRGKGSAGRGRT